ncbi:MAG: hypothetical protein PF637_02590 [Spirochaetes bacterium]|nr:hypothetical protein [Spirochaetota bacterium]
MNFKIKNIILFIFFLSVLFASCSTASNHRVSFKGGKPVFDKELCTMFMSDDDKKYLVITNPCSHFAFILPFETNWTFSKSGRYALFGTNGYKNISIDIINNINKTDINYLETRKNNFEKNSDRYGVEKTKFIKTYSIPVLKTEVNIEKVMKNLGKDFPKKNLKQYNYFVTRVYDKTRYTLHFSVLASGNKDNGFNESYYLKTITKSFDVNFKRDGK